jgi:hypothetical protein
MPITTTYKGGIGGPGRSQHHHARRTDSTWTMCHACFTPPVTGAQTSTVKPTLTSRQRDNGICPTYESQAGMSGLSTRQRGHGARQGETSSAGKSTAKSPTLLNTHCAAVVLPALRTDCTAPALLPIHCLRFSPGRSGQALVCRKRRGKAAPKQTYR